MILSVKGKLIKKLNIESGTSKAGKEWKKQSFVLNTETQFNPEICFQLFGEEKITMFEHYNEGDSIEVSFNLSSKEWNGKYFHNVDAWKIEKIQEDRHNEFEPTEEPPIFDATASEEDDLPF